MVTLTGSFTARPPGLDGLSPTASWRDRGYAATLPLSTARGPQAQVFRPGVDVPWMGVVERYRPHSAPMLIDDLPGCLVAAESDEHVEESSREEEGVSLPAAIRRQHHGRRRAAPFGDDRVDHARRDLRLITEQHRHGLRLRVQGGDPRAIGRGTAVAEFRILDDGRLAEVDGFAHTGRRGAD